VLQHGIVGRIPVEVDEEAVVGGARPVAEQVAQVPPGARGRALKLTPVDADDQERNTFS
jgi:hypothetical protein